MARPLRPPSDARRLTRVGGRTRDLQRRYTDTADGIRYDTMNVGDWLNINTAGEDGITFSADQGSISFEAVDTGAGRIYLSSRDFVALFAMDNEAGLYHGHLFFIVADDADPDRTTELVIGMAETGFQLVPGGVFRVQDQDANILFQIDYDGTVHIKTGTSIIDDL